MDSGEKRSFYFFLKLFQSLISHFMLFDIMIIIARPTTSRVNTISQIVKISFAWGKRRENREEKIDWTD
jgi:hypothetical protein